MGDASEDTPADSAIDPQSMVVDAPADSERPDTQLDVESGCLDCAREIVTPPYVVEPQPIAPQATLTIRFVARAPVVLEAWLSSSNGSLVDFVNETGTSGLQTLSATVPWAVLTSRNLTTSTTGTTTEELSVNLIGNDLDRSVTVQLGGCPAALCSGACVTCPSGATGLRCSQGSCQATGCNSGLALCGGACLAPVQAYVDSDGDGFGTGELVDGCNGNGYASQSGDCDDNDEYFHPEPNSGGPSLRDYNCDGLVQRVYPACVGNPCEGPTTTLACVSLRIDCWRNGRACGFIDEYAAACMLVSGTCVPNWALETFVTCQ